MTTFTDGPAQGQCLMLISTPIFLRVTEMAGKWDALNLPGDKPLNGETLYAYLLVEHRGFAMIDGGKFRGRCPMVSYAYIEPQPSQAVMGFRDSWIAWVDQAATLQAHVTRSKLLAQLKNPHERPVVQ